MMNLRTKVASILATGLLVAACGTADPNDGDTTSTTLPDITTTAPGSTSTTEDTSTTETTEGDTTTTDDSTTTTAN
jgi:ABC-type glycerol-3-phosphate transport system substrate-binding protein